MRKNILSKFIILTGLLFSFALNAGNKENFNNFEIENIKNKILEINNNLEIIITDYRNFPKEWFADLLNKSIDNKIIDKNFSL